MKIDLAKNEEELHSLKGKTFVANPLVRILAKFGKLVGKYSNVEISITNHRVHVYEENKFLWFIVTGRNRKVFSLGDIDMLHAVQTSFLFIFKSHNIIIYNGGIPWTGVNVRSVNYAGLEQELNGISLIKTNFMQD